MFVFQINLMIFQTETTVFIVTYIVESLLIDDSINGDSSFSSLTITNDQLTLTSSNWYKRIYSFDSSLKIQFHKNVEISKLPCYQSHPQNLLNHNGVKFQPTCIGSLTDCLGIIPGALRPTRNRWLDVIGPAPSIGLPKASTTRPKSSVPTGTSTMAPVRLTTSPSLISLSLPKWE